MYDIVSKRNWYFAFSAALIAIGIVFILIGGLRPSIDFTGGTQWEVRYAQQPTAEEMQLALAELGHPDAVITTLDDGFLRIRTSPIGLLAPAPVVVPSPAPTVDVTPDPDATPTPEASPTPAPEETPGVAPAPSPEAVPPIAEETEFAELHGALIDRFGEGQPRLLTTVGPIIGAELIQRSIIIIAVGELFILGYLWIRFGFRYGTAAIVALVHDVLFVVGSFAVLGYFFGVEFDALFVTALLAVIAFSVNDTVVVFDRVRENRVRHAGEPFGAIVNHSILQTFSRSINTSLTVVVTLLALLLLGPSTIQTFTLALLIGIIAGTYSSIFNASQVLVAWDAWAARRKASAASGTRSSRAVKPLSR
jgi:preprotein translocase subunit SecF